MNLLIYIALFYLVSLFLAWTLYRLYLKQIKQEPVVLDIVLVILPILNIIVAIGSALMLISFSPKCFFRL